MLVSPECIFYNAVHTPTMKLCTQETALVISKAGIILVYNSDKHTRLLHHVFCSRLCTSFKMKCPHCLFCMSSGSQSLLNTQYGRNFIPIGDSTQNCCYKVRSTNCLQYLSIMQHYSFPSLELNLSWHKNTPVHIARYMKTRFDKFEVEQLECPAPSPDLNPIEHLWDDVQCQLKLNEYEFSQPHSKNPMKLSQRSGDNSYSSKAGK